MNNYNNRNFKNYSRNANPQLSYPNHQPLGGALGGRSAHMQGNYPATPTVLWRPVERKIRGTTVVDIKEQPLRVPKFSFAVAAGRLDPNGQILETLPYMSIYAIPDLIEALREVHTQYMQKREDAIKERERETQRYQHEDDVDYEADLETREAPLAAPRRR